MTEYEKLRLSGELIKMTQKQVELKLIDNFEQKNEIAELDEMINQYFIDIKSLIGIIV